MGAAVELLRPIPHYLGVNQAFSPLRSLSPTDVGSTLCALGVERWSISCHDVVQSGKATVDRSGGVRDYRITNLPRGYSPEDVWGSARGELILGCVEIALGLSERRQGTEDGPVLVRGEDGEVVLRLARQRDSLSVAFLDGTCPRAAWDVDLLRRSTSQLHSELTSLVAWTLASVERFARTELQPIKEDISRVDTVTAQVGPFIADVSRAHTLPEALQIPLSISSLPDLSVQRLVELGTLRAFQAQIQSELVVPVEGRRSGVSTFLVAQRASIDLGRAQDLMSL